MGIERRKATLTLSATSGFARTTVRETSDEFSQRPRMTSSQSGWTSQANAPLPPTDPFVKASIKL